MSSSLQAITKHIETFNMENIYMSADGIFTWQRKCSNYKSINLQSHTIVNKLEIYWSKLNNWTNTKVSSCIGLKLTQISHGIQVCAKHSCSKDVATKACLKAYDSCNLFLPPTFNFNSIPFSSSTQMNPFFFPLIHNYHNSTFERSKQTSDLIH
jgi:hypothetical protein